MKIAILSLFPEMFDSFLNTSIIGRARQEVKSGWAKRRREMFGKK